MARPSKHGLGHSSPKISVRLAEKSYKRLWKVANESDITMSEFVRRLINEDLDKAKKQKKTRPGR